VASLSDNTYKSRQDFVNPSLYEVSLSLLNQGTLKGEISLYD